VRRVLEEVGGGRAKRRRLALALAADASVLTTGRSPAPRVVGDLLLALRAAGSDAIAPPRCAECDREIASLQRRGEEWLCSPCFVRPQICAGCGEERQAAFRDRNGEPRCGACRDRTFEDPLAALVGQITAIDRGLTEEAVRSAVTATVSKATHIEKLLWAFQAAPELLTGEVAKAPFRMVLRLIDALCDVGATVVHRPLCGRCGRVVTLSKKLDGLRVCRNCCARAHAVACSKCGSVREPAARDRDGRPLCPHCLVSDPINLEECRVCGRRRRVSTRGEDGPICQACLPKTMATCSVCGRHVWWQTSTITGQPWCHNCSRSWALCSDCGTLAPVRGGTRTAPLCAACTTADPTIWKTCPSCGEAGRLLSRVCVRCHLRERLDELMDDGDGDSRPELRVLHEALGSVRPATALGWLSKESTVSMLSALARGETPLSHATLDELPQTKTLAHLRSVLVATDALPARDEHLTRLEAWIADAIATHAGPDERQWLHRYAVWHVLRRLRQRNRTAFTTAAQASHARENVRAAGEFLNWLAARQLTLAGCSQRDLETWMAAATTARRGRTGPFVRWAKSQKLTALDFPATGWAGPTGVLDLEGRWEQARRLLHDDALPREHRVAGLLVLLYAQRASTISRLTVDDVVDGPGGLRLRLGREPVVLPEPVADLVHQLLAIREGHATIGSNGSSPWLFPGGRPGQPISAPQLVECLHGIGIYPGDARSTALFQLASEIPAAILVRLLGIHISVAVKWQRTASGDWTGYAAEIVHRSNRATAALASETEQEG
jgi:hypothetical protein